MRTALAELTLRSPRHLGEALAMLAEEPLVPFAGGTDLYVWLNAGTFAGRRFVDLHALDELRGIALRDDRLVLGALTTHAELAASPLVAAQLPILAAAAREIGGPQVRNRGTLGGNIMSGSPAGDTLPVLAVAEAELVLQSVAGERRVPFSSFFIGYRRKDARPEELLVSIEVPPVPGRQWYRKVGTRAAQAISKVVMAGVHAPGEWRLACGSVGPTVIRCRRTEAALHDSLPAAKAALREEIHPIDDHRSTATYRRAVAENLLARFVAETTP